MRLVQTWPLIIAASLLLIGCQSTQAAATSPGSKVHYIADDGYVVHKAPAGLAAPISPLPRPNAAVAQLPPSPTGGSMNRRSWISDGGPANRCRGA